MPTGSALMDYRAPPPAPEAPEQPPPEWGRHRVLRAPPHHPIRRARMLRPTMRSRPEPLITATIETAPADKAPGVAPLPPPQADLSDPYQRRASAVGLHPDMSRALLARLSTAELPQCRGRHRHRRGTKQRETDTFVWPRQRRPELALFQVRFVPGAAPDCRRYVVTITKDRWSTTALPMERCGAKLAGARAPMILLRP